MWWLLLANDCAASFIFIYFFFLAGPKALFRSHRISFVLNFIVLRISWRVVFGLVHTPSYIYLFTRSRRPDSSLAAFAFYVRAQFIFVKTSSGFVCASFVCLLVFRIFQQNVQDVHAMHAHRFYANTGHISEYIYVYICIFASGFSPFLCMAPPHSLHSSHSPFALLVLVLITS